MSKNNNNLLAIVLVILLVLVFFGGYGIMSFNSGVFDGYYGIGGMLGLIALLCAIWVIYDVFTNNRGLSDGMKLFWIILAIFFSIITALIYFLIGRNNENDLFRNRK